MRLWGLAVVGGAVALGAGALGAAAASAEEAPGLRCFKVRERGTVERICESAHVVTIETLPQGETPSPAALRAHAVERFPPAPGPVAAGAPPAAPPPAATLSAATAQVPVRDWSGLRIGLGPWGALSHPAASSGFGLSGRLGYDVVPEDAPAAVIGVAVEQAGFPAGGRSSAAAAAITSLDIRVGALLWGRLMPYVTAGLATATRHLSIGGGSDVGGGIVYAVDARWAVSLDYRHFDLRPDAPSPGRAGRPAAVSVDSLAATLTYRIL